jgi:hypothetical protein
MRVQLECSDARPACQAATLGGCDLQKRSAPPGGEWEALGRCRRVSLTGLEPGILLAWARWHDLSGDPEEARRFAEEALRIADRCEYRLKQADIHNFLAHLGLGAGNVASAREHAETARERAAEG